MNADDAFLCSVYIFTFVLSSFLNNIAVIFKPVQSAAVLDTRAASSSRTKVWSLLLHGDPFSQAFCVYSLNVCVAFSLCVRCVCVSYEILQTGRHFEYHKPNPSLGCHFFWFCFSNRFVRGTLRRELYSWGCKYPAKDTSCCHCLQLFQLPQSFFKLGRVESCQSVCVHH